MTAHDDRVDITPWLRRAYALQERRGEVAVTAVLDREDVVACRTALRVVTAARAIGGIIGMPAPDARDMDTLIDVLGSFTRMIDEPDMNWKEGTDA